MRKSLIIGCTVSLVLVFVAYQLVTDRSFPTNSEAQPVGEITTMSSQGNLQDTQLFQPSAPISGDVIYSLIISGEESDFKWTRKTPAAKRLRCIALDPTLMTSDPVLKNGKQLELALFDDAVFLLEISKVTRYPNGAVGITAHLQGDDDGVAFLSYSCGELRASIEVCGADDYYIRYNPETKSHYAVQVDHENSVYLECDEPLIPPLNNRAEAGPQEALPPSPADVINNPVALGDIPSGYPEDTVEVDVLVVYTPAARIVEGGVNGINNNIAIALERANEAHGNSDTRVYLNLVHSAETSYTESGNALTDMEQLTYSGGVYSAMDDVHALRNTYHADLVCLLEDDPEIGGRGWLLTRALGRSDFAFSIAGVQYSDIGYAVVHEWGHNMGCHHSAGQAYDPGPGLFSYSSGWQWDDTAASSIWPYTQQGYCSIMTYQNFDNLGGASDYEYTRVAYFSNPNVSYTGDSTNPTGGAVQGDNARTIREIRYTVAGYRIDPSPISQFPYNNSFDVGFSDWVHYEGSASWVREDGTDAGIVDNAPHIATTSAADGSIFLMTDGSKGAGKTALLEAIFDLSELSSASFKFSYCMYSVWGFEGVNRLQVSSNGGVNWETLWSNSGKSDNNWYQANIDLTAYVGETNVQLRFDAVMGDTWYKNYMCLDAFSMTGDVNPDGDIDADGIPNGWEIQYYGGATNADPIAFCSNGINTIREAYIAGFDPTDSDAKFVITQFETWPSYIIQWDSMAERFYTIYWTSNLLSDFELLTNNITGGTYTDTVHEVDGSGFYRIRVHLTPSVDE